MNLETASDKIRTYVGFAIKANKIALGIDKILSLKKMPQVILYDSNIGRDTLKKLMRIKENGADVYIADKLDEITNKKGVKVIGITETSLAAAISKIYKEKWNERT